MHKFVQIFICSLLIFSCLFGISGCNSKEDSFILVDSEQQNTEPESTESDVVLAEVEEDSTGEAERLEDELIYVFVCGQVQRPGVYALSGDKRVCDAIEMAGGCLDTADICAVNQAERLTDGSQIYIPAIGEASTMETGDISVDDGLIHLNQAGKEELMTLPGIGESKAEAILEYREAHGGFATKEELMNIPGIKEGVFQKIQELITVK